MLRRPPRSTRTDTLFPYTTLFRSSPAPRHNRGAVHLIDWLLADHRKDMVLKAGNPVGMAPVLPALLQCFVTVTRGLLKIRNDFAGLAPPGDRIDRKSVVSGKRGSVRVDLGGGGNSKKKTDHEKREV